MIRTHNHLVCKRTLNYSAKLARSKLETWRLFWQSSSLTFRQNYRVWILSETRTWHDNNIQESFSSISTSSSNISISASFQHIYTQVLNRHYYVWKGSANHLFKFLVPLNHIFRFLVPLNTLFYSYAKVKEKLKWLIHLTS